MPRATSPGPFRSMGHCLAALISSSSSLRGSAAAVSLSRVSSGSVVSSRSADSAVTRNRSLVTLRIDFDFDFDVKRPASAHFVVDPILDCTTKNTKIEEKRNIRAFTLTSFAAALRRAC